MPRRSWVLFLSPDIINVLSCEIIKLYFPEMHFCLSVDMNVQPRAFPRFKSLAVPWKPQQQ